MRGYLIFINLKFSCDIAINVCKRLSVLHPNIAVSKRVALEGKFNTQSSCAMTPA